MRFKVDTEHPVAVLSYDHVYPRGAVNDNSWNPLFNAALIGMRPWKPSVLDLGCAGGKFVWSLIKSGCPAVGIEGSDRNQKSGAHCWKSIPGALFTADITKPFTVHTGDSVPYKFDVITLWEVFEHIEKKDLSAVMANIRNHSKPGSLLVCSISDRPAVYSNGYDLHRTQQPRQWWVELFGRHGFRERKDIHKRFNGQLVRSGACFDSTFEFTGGE